ncbi:hypothetical protein [Desulfonatronovibrio magnus]|nr:hypothetical protein [Desulfonatronovibrio magnus]
MDIVKMRITAIFLEWSIPLNFEDYLPPGGADPGAMLWVRHTIHTPK